MTSFSQVAARYEKACRVALAQGAAIPDCDGYLEQVPEPQRGELRHRLNEIRGSFDDTTCVLSAPAEGSPRSQHDTSGPGGETVSLDASDSSLSVELRQPPHEDERKDRPRESLTVAWTADKTVSPAQGLSAAGDPDATIDPSAADPQATIDPAGGSDSDSVAWNAAADPEATMAPERSSSEATGEFSLSENVSPAGPAPPARKGKYPTVAGYEILSELGRGGMGVVYKARQRALNRLVALKMILAGTHAGQDQLARFRAEAEAVAALQHPNIVQIYDVGEQEGLPYFSLEFIDGQPLDRYLDGQPQVAAWAAEMTESLARAMHHAHEMGIVHRDLKPANVLLNSAGVPKITDFGLVKRMEGSEDSSQTRTGTIMGTPSYMAPEQGRGEKDIGPLADVYALGSMLYCFLTGRPPFLAATPFDTLMQLLKDEPVAPTRLQPKIPRDLETICLKSIQKDPRKRYESAWELAEDLHRFRNQEPIQARPIGRVERVWRWCRRNPRVASLTSAVVILLVAAVGAATAAGRQAARERENVARVRTQAVEQLDQARGEILAGRWERAQALLSHPDPMLEESGELRTEREQFHQLRDQVEVYGAAKQLMNRVRYYGLFGARGTLRTAREACHEFFELYDDLQTRRDQGSWGLPPLSDDQRQLFNEDVFEVYVVATQVEMALAAETQQLEKIKEAGERCLRWLDRADQVLPDTRFLHLRRAQIHQDMGNAEAAQQERSRGLEIDPTSVVDRFWDAISHHQDAVAAKAQGKLPEARQLLLAACSDYAELLRIRPDHFWAYFDWAACQVLFDDPGSLQNAIVGFNTCIQLQPQVAWPYYNRGLAYYRLQQVDGALTDERKRELLRLAIEDFSAAIAHNADYTDAYYNRGLMYASLNEDEAALNDIAAAMQLDATNPLFYYQRAEVYRKQKKYDLARQDYTRALERDPLYFDCYVNRGATYLEQKDYAGALPDFQKLIELRPRDPGAYERRGTVNLLINDLAAAETDFLKLAELLPDNPMVRYRLSIIYRVRRQYEKAAAELERVTQVAPQNLRAFLMLSHVYHRQGRLDEALTQLDALQPNLPQDAAFQAGYWNDRGDLLRSMRRWEEAAEAYMQSVKLLPEQSDAYSGLVLNRQASGGTAAEILPIYEQWLVAQPKPEVYLRRAEYHREQGDYASAAADAQKAAELEPESPLPRIVAAGVLAAQGQATEAVARLTQLVTPKSPPAAKYAAAAVLCLAARGTAAADQDQGSQWQSQAVQLLLESLEEGWSVFSLHQYNRVCVDPAFADLSADPRCAALFLPQGELP